MIRVMPDTHTLYWLESQSRRLSDNARSLMRQAEEPGSEILLHPIVLAEFCHLVAKSGQAQLFTSYLGFLRTSPTHRLVEISLEDIELYRELQVIPEMHDRLIAACAIRYDAVVVTHDAQIRRCARVRTCW